jgi:hypothetical protein
MPADQKSEIEMGLSDETMFRLLVITTLASLTAWAATGLLAGS